MRARSSGVAVRSQASSPMTNMRSGVCPTSAATFTVHGSARSASRYSGNVIQRPRHRIGEHRGRHVLDVREHRAQRLALLRMQRRERERAIADEHRGDAVLRHGVATGIPEERGVEVGVRIDEAGRHRRATRVELLLVGPGSESRTDLGDHPVGDADVLAARGRTRAVDHLTPADEETGHRCVHAKTTGCRSIIRLIRTRESDQLTPEPNGAGPNEVRDGHLRLRHALLRDA